MGGKGSGSKPRNYPEEIVEQVMALYESGHTTLEISSMIPRGYKAQNIIERHVKDRRRLGKRNQRGVMNDSWKGDAATYQALHLRVRSERGVPGPCTECSTEEVARHWANQTGNYTDVNDYQSMCPRCHLRFDAARREALGMPTMGIYSKGGRP